MGRLTDATDLSSITFYSANDPRVAFLEELGMGLPKAIESTKRSKRFIVQLSAEQIDRFDDATMIVTYAGKELFDAMKNDPLVSKMSAVKNGSFFYLLDGSISAAEGPTSLMLRHYIDEYANALAAGIK